MVMRELLVIAGVVLLGLTAVEVATQWNFSGQAINPEALRLMEVQTEIDARHMRMQTDPDFPPNEITSQ